MALISVAKLYVRLIVLHNTSMSSREVLILTSFLICVHQFSHIHLFKYEDTRYTRDNLAYTRIGLSDLSDDFVSIMHCQTPGKSTTCFQIVNRSNPAISDNQCHSSEIRSEEIEEEKYMINQPLLYDASRKNRILISKTDNLIPDFLDYLLKYLH